MADPRERGPRPALHTRRDFLSLASGVVFAPLAASLAAACAPAAPPTPTPTSETAALRATIAALQGTKPTAAPPTARVAPEPTATVPAKESNKQPKDVYMALLNTQIQTSDLPPRFVQGGNHAIDPNKTLKDFGAVGQVLIDLGENNPKYPAMLPSGIISYVVFNDTRGAQNTYKNLTSALGQKGVPTNTPYPQTVEESVNGFGKVYTSRVIALVDNALMEIRLTDLEGQSSGHSKTLELAKGGVQHLQRALTSR